MDKPAEWLDPARWDALPVLGVGAFSRVLAAGRWALKVAHPEPRARRALLKEVRNFGAVSDTPAAPLAPRLLAHRADGRAILRARLPGSSLLASLESGEAERTDWTAFAEAHARCEAHFAWTGERLDFAPSNLFWLPRLSAFQLCDLGERLDPSPFEGRQAPELPAALDAYLAFRRERFGPGRVVHFLPPPSARFHVEVACGRTQGARVLWLNRPLLSRLGLEWDERRALALGDLSTTSARASRVRCATRYQDGPKRSHGKGDGRVVYAGGARGLEITAKGVGPTPLAWRGERFHEDGRVSFPRTLWEASVCDELERLGFVAPRVAAIISNGATTVDNTEREWPAATSLRLSETHYRPGHLHRAAHEPDALRELLGFIGRQLLGPSFDPARPAHVERFLWRFTETLAHDVGRTEALNVLCFNPTMGNVRLDGHLIDFSTVRFFKHTYSDFVFMNGRRTTREHTATLRRHATELFACLRSLMDEGRRERVRAQLPERFERAHHRGYLSGVGRFLGLDLEPLATRARGRSLVRELRRLRALRSDAVHVFRYWKQSCRGPLFDLEHRAAEWLASGDPEDLRAADAGPPDAFAQHCAQQAHGHLRALTDLTAARPRRWDQVLRPFIELEALAALCYERSAPDDFAEWQDEVAR